MITTSRFFRALTAPYSAYPAARLQIRSYRPEWHDNHGRPGPCAWFLLDDQNIAAAAAFAAATSQQGYETYHAVLPRVNGGGKASDVRVCAWLWTDIDAGNQGRQESIALLKLATQRGIPTPNLIVASGGGIHAYWRLPDIAPCHNKIDQDIISATLKRLVLFVGGDDQSAHACPKATDVARILRPPGTHNHKRRDQPRPVELLRENSAGPLWSLRQWRSFLPPLPLPPRPLTPRPHSLRRIPMGEIPRSVSDLIQRPPRPGERNRALWRAAVAMRKRNLPQDSIAATLYAIADSCGYPDADTKKIINWSDINVVPDPEFQ